MHAPGLGSNSRQSPTFRKNEGSIVDTQCLEPPVLLKIRCRPGTNGPASVQADNHHTVRSKGPSAQTNGQKVVSPFIAVARDVPYEYRPVLAAAGEGLTVRG